MHSSDSFKWKKEAGWIGTLLLVIATMVMIFCFSAQNAEKSSAASGKIVNVVIDVTVPDYDRLPAQQQTVISENISHYVRKLAHFTEFAMLGFFLCFHVHFVRRRIGLQKMEKGKDTGRSMLWLTPLISFFTGVLYACTDEFHQNFSEGRGPGIVDVFIDSSGVLFGTMIVVIVLLIIRKRKKIRQE